MKKNLLPVFLFCFTLTGICQLKIKTEEKFYLLNKDFNAAKEADAMYFIHVQKINDSCQQYDTYNVNGPIISSEQFTGTNDKLRNGFFSTFNEAGNIDSSGYYAKGLQSGTWLYFDSSGAVIIKRDFVDGQVKNTEYLKNRQTVKAVYIADSTIIHVGDTLQTHTEVESHFPGGKNSWGQYLYKNLTYPDEDVKKMIQGRVEIWFKVDEKGNISEPVIHKSVDYYLDKEALRIIRTSPPWVPATIDGTKVKSYKLQPLGFKLVSQGFQ